MISSDNISVSRLVRICHKMGIKDIIFSPGSRNAPMVISFVESELFNTYCIPDERVAAFYALGMSIATKRPTIICCTSGSAVLNYAPAISEAYYQGVPLIVLTADRPVEWIDQGVGQSIRQKNVYNNYIKASYELIQEASLPQEVLTNDNFTVEAIHNSTQGFPGPVHINVPLVEPLYNVKEYVENPIIEISNGKFETAQATDYLYLEEIWKKRNRKIILMGMAEPDDDVKMILSSLVNQGDVVLMCESSSNCNVPHSVQTIDRVITNFGDDSELYKADLLISLGGPIISKKVLSYFLKFQPLDHWYVSMDSVKDTFRSLTEYVELDYIQFSKLIIDWNSPNQTDFQSLWMQQIDHVQNRHNQFISLCQWSDLKVFSILLSAISEDSVLHMGNSTVVRYIQLFEPKDNIEYLGNRGVSGIDGCTSTAMGFALKSTKQNILITGDIAFYYDSNAFWSKHRPDNLKIILINNQGGSIFRIIPGPSDTHQLKEYFESYQDCDAKHLAQHFNVKYLQAHDEPSLLLALADLLNDDAEMKLLEIFTPREQNDIVLNNYFSALK